MLKFLVDNDALFAYLIYATAMVLFAIFIYKLFKDNI